MATGVLKYSLDGGVTWLSMLGGPKGAPGVGVPAGGITAQALVKKSNADYDTEWKTPVISQEVFVDSNLPISWASGIYAVKAGTLVSVSGLMTCLNGHFLAPPNTGTIGLVTVSTIYRPAFEIFGTCYHRKIADGFRTRMNISVLPNGDLTLWAESSGSSTYQFLVNDTLSVSVTYRVA